MKSVTLSERLAKSEGVADRCEFRCEDVMKVENWLRCSTKDGEQTIVFLHLLPEALTELEPVCED